MGNVDVEVLLLGPDGRAHGDRSNFPHALTANFAANKILHD